MLAFVIRRLVQADVVMLTVALIAFTLFRFVGDPINQMVGIEISAEERAAITVAPGIYAPNCGQHVALTRKDYFQITTVTPPGGQALTWRGAIVAWLTGTPVSVIDTQPASLSVCAPPVDNGE